MRSTTKCAKTGTEIVGRATRPKWRSCSRSPTLIGNLCALNALKTSGWPPGLETRARREDAVAVFKKMERLFWGPSARGPISAYALWPLAHGGPPTSWSGQVDDPNQPYLLVKDLEASAKGCQALLDEWTILRSRVEDNVPWQPPDRLKAIRMCSGNNLSTWRSIGDSLRFTAPPSRCTRLAGRMRTMTSSATWRRSTSKTS